MATFQLFLDFFSYLDIEFCLLVICESNLNAPSLSIFHFFVFFAV